jgi:murein DD-endopeptidase MepM/ murein hydrolase activator NlpD
MKRIITAIMSLCLLLLADLPTARADDPGPAAAATDLPRGVAPLLGDVSTGFDPPDQPWLAGHRGVDIVGDPGGPIKAALAGQVSFAGMVAGRPVISLRHGDLMTTYEPVVATVSVGDEVGAGQVIGTLETGHTSCPEKTCLHWGLRRSETYLNPLDLLSPAKIRLIAGADMEAVRRHAIDLELRASAERASAAGLVNPATGVVTSEFGMRLHPISGTWRFHDGLDIGAACGTPIVTAATGTVTEVGYSGGHGNRLVIDHGTIAGVALKTSYSHAQGFSVAVGDTITAGQTVGLIGSTGDSTGCHLHFQVWSDGDLVDPAPLLP